MVQKMMMRASMGGGPDHIAVARSKLLAMLSDDAQVWLCRCRRTLVIAVAPRDGTQAGHPLLGLGKGRMALDDGAARVDQPSNGDGELPKRGVDGPVTACCDRAGVHHSRLKLGDF